MFDKNKIILNRLYADGNPYAIPFDKDVIRKLMVIATLGVARGRGAGGPGFFSFGHHLNLGTNSAL